MPDEGPTAADAQFESIVARLHEEVERSGDLLPATAGRGAVRVRRREADALWAVTADRPFLYRPGPWGRARGLVLVPLKSVLRRLMRWYVEPLATDQRRFNHSVLMLADALAERMQTDRAELQQQLAPVETRLAAVEPELPELQRRLDALAEESAAARARLAADEARERRTLELEERLTRMERRPAAPASAVPATAAAARQPVALPDYFALHSRLRGSAEAVRERQRRYVDDFRDAAPVLDVGCGRGEFLALLREAGIEARGVDLDPDMVAYVRGEGLAAERGDAVAYLDGLPDGSLGGVFAAQLVEHLPPAALVRLLALAAAKLRPGGVLVAETINPLSPLALRNYFADLTHAQPLVPETLELLARQAGFRTTEIRYANEPERKLEEPADSSLAENARRLNELLFAPLDYAVVARTGRPPKHAVATDRPYG